MPHNSFLMLTDSTIYGYEIIPAIKGDKIIGFVLINTRVSRAVLMWSLSNSTSNFFSRFFSRMPLIEFFHSLKETNQIERSLIEVFNTTRLIVQNIDYSFDERILQMIRIQSLNSHSRTAIEGLNFLNRFIGRSHNYVLREFLHESFRDLRILGLRENLNVLRESSTLGVLVIHQEDANWFLQRVSR